MTLTVGTLTTVNQDNYPGLGDWWVQVWLGEEVFARAYASDHKTARTRAMSIASSIHHNQLLTQALERLIKTYDGFEDGNGEPCPDIEFAKQVLQGKVDTS